MFLSGKCCNQLGFCSKDFRDSKIEKAATNYLPASWNMEHMY